MTEPAIQEAAPRRIVELDALRGIAVIAVMLFHYVHRYGVVYGHKDQLWFTIRHHTFGIPMFFMLSGYLIYFVLERTKRPLDFIVSRFSRLYPAYWFCLLMTVIVSRWGELEGRRLSLSETLWNLLMFQEFLNKPFADGAYWTLSLELSFYATLLLLFTAGLLNRVEWMVLVWLVLVYWDGLLRRDMGVRLDDRLEIFFLLQYGQYFGAGVLMYRLRHAGFSMFRAVLLAGCFAAPLVLKRYPSDFIALFGMALFSLAVFEKLPFLKWKPLLFLGAISYPVYLLHQNIGYVIIKWLTAAGVNSNWAIIAAILVILAAGTAVTFAVEKPALHIIRAAYKRKRASSQPNAQALAEAS